MNPFDLNAFQWKMLNLDCALTGNAAPSVAQQMHHKPKSPAEWLNRGREWYLSDGGYSRVWFGEDCHLFLGGTSLDGPRAAWERSMELIADVEEELRLELLLDDKHVVKASTLARQYFGERAEMAEVGVVDESARCYVMYHGASSANRESIRVKGLLLEFSEAAQIGGTGVICLSQKKYSHRADSFIDKWEVDVRGLNLYEDDTTDPEDPDDHWWQCFENIPPQRLKLVHAGK